MITVIIPVYNAETTIERALNSARLADRIICVDDGSIDNSAKIIHNWNKKHRNVTYIYQENSGAARARNKGIAHCETEFVMFLDSDDTLSINVIPHFKSLVHQYNKDVYIGRIEHVKNGKKVVIKSHTYREGETTLNDMPSILQSIGPGAKLYRTSQLTTFDEDIIFCEEHTFNVHMFMKQVYVTDHVVYYYHDTEGSITKSYENAIQYINDAVIVRNRVYTMLKHSDTAVHLYYSYRMDELIVSYLIKHTLRHKHNSTFILAVIKYIENMIQYPYREESLNKIVLFVDLYGNKSERKTLHEFFKNKNISLNDYILDKRVKGQLFKFKTRLKDTIKAIKNNRTSS
ncbi:glycosyltransferase family 2 protein [Macrococcus armenti]|uniref:glycosyltransferase family 2 protein n=1 Tax=Macrococcus armenti TaxID=2875764 RepID=UPI001CD01DA3|nr:glycosyltransferase family 2 protein [Macrococcus armenti]UBH23075.1 glycosyltransferase family 2 protein [Macrococcus armenti]